MWSREGGEKGPHGWVHEMMVMYMKIYDWIWDRRHERYIEMAGVWDERRGEHLE